MKEIVIAGRRVRSLRRRLAVVPAGTPITLAVRVTEERRSILQSIGLGARPEPGTSILPPDLGSVSRFNAEGRLVPNKKLPMETAYRQVWWTWKLWNGEEQGKYVDVPYQRYPREFTPPPAVELTCVATQSGERYLVIEGGVYPPSNEEALVHKVNLMLELFGEVSVLRPDLTPFVPAQVQRLNWELLPPGRHPWDTVRPALESAIERAKGGNRPFLRHRWDTIGHYEPDFIAAGQGGFNGYVVFGFERLGLYLLESAVYGNATYVVGHDWQHLSQLTKAELLNEALHEERIVHRADSWPARINELLAPALEDKAA